MSRTVRRKNSHHEEYYTRDWVKRQSKYGGVYFVRVRLEGKALSKSLARFHSCKSSFWDFPRPYTRKSTEEAFRVEIKNELNKFKKDPDYPVQLRGKKRLPWD